MFSKITTFTLLSLATNLFPISTLAQQPQSSQPLTLGPINFTTYSNYVYRDPITSAQLVLSNNVSTSPSRLITAFPEGNTGTLTYFLPLQNGSDLLVSLIEGSLRSYTDGGVYNQSGLTGNLTFSNDASLGVTIIGSIRAVRDYTEGSGLMHSIFNYTLSNYSDSKVELKRNWINGTTVQYLIFEAISNMVFNVTPSSNITIPPIINFLRNNTTSPGSLKFLTTFNYSDTPILTPGLEASSVFLSTPPVNASEGLVKVIKALQTNNSTGSNSTQVSFNDKAKQFSFLAYENKFLAGGWRFLTYFGRDTLLALRLLLPVMTSEAIEAVLGAVLERLNDLGEVCHEETIGDYASFVNINNNQSSLGAQSSCSYIMLDTDFLLLPSLAHYILSTPQGQNSSTFLAQNATLQNATYLQLLEKNARHVLNLTTPFGVSGQCGDLLEIRDPVVGNWRDSTAGLGYGKVPFDVNTALVPGALRAIASLASAGILPQTIGQFNSTNLTLTSLNALASKWEQSSIQCFEVSISKDVGESRLIDYVGRVNLSRSLLEGEGSLNSSIGMNESGVSNQTMGGNLTFYALSLDTNGSKVEILNSDLGFTLLYNNNVSVPLLEATTTLLTPYPRGLLTNIGMVVANSAYTSNRTAIQDFTETAYHGSVVWSWQQALIAAGLEKQLSRCGGVGGNGTSASSTSVDYLDSGERPGWCDTGLVGKLKDAQGRLWDSIAGSSSALFTEVYSPLWDNSTQSFTIGDLGAISPSGTEGDAIQLWSYAFLSQLDPRTGEPVASMT